MSTKSYRSIFYDMKNEWKWIFKKARRYWWRISLYAAFGIIGTCMGLTATIFSKKLIDDVISHSTNTIIQSAACVIGLAVGQIVFKALTAWITAVIDTKTSNELRADIYSGILGSKWEAITDYHSGDLLNRLEGDTSTVSNGMISFIPNVITKAVQFFGALAIVLYYDKMMAVLALISAPVLVLSSRYMVKTMRKFNKQSRELNGQILSYSEESLKNIQVIKAFNLTKQYINNFSELLNVFRKVKLKYEKFSVLMSLILSSIGLIVSYGCYGWGVWRLWQGAVSFGTMTLFIQLSGSLSSSFSSLVSLAPSAISIATSAGRIKEISERTAENDADKDKAVKMLSDSAHSGIGVFSDKASFKYKNGESPVLDSVDFSVSPGETIAFIGPSGEGKTTLLRLILGLLEPQSGSIVFKQGNHELPASDNTRRFCSYIPQKSELFTGTVAENLRIVKPNATDEELIASLSQAELWNHIASLPNGLDSLIGENGVNFSEGQAQRISIARALLRQSPVLIMDEATSALDADTENKVLSNIMCKSTSRACIITTHRPSVLKYCNRIYKITSEGQIYEINASREEIK